MTWGDLVVAAKNGHREPEWKVKQKCPTERMGSRKQFSRKVSSEGNNGGTGIEAE